MSKEEEDEEKKEEKKEVYSDFDWLGDTVSGAGKGVGDTVGVSLLFLFPFHPFLLPFSPLYFPPPSLLFFAAVPANS